MAEPDSPRAARPAAADPAALLGGGAIAALAASPRAEAIVCEAARIAGAWGLSLAFLNVGAGEAERAELAALVAARAPGAALAFAEGKRVDQALCEAARERAAGLILLGALEHEAGLAWYLGSVARRVARQAPCSTLLLAHPRLEPTPFVRPQVNLEIAERGRGVLGLALALARREGAQDLHAVVEYDAHGLHSGTAEDDAGDVARYRQALQHQEELALAAFVAAYDQGGVAVRRFCAPGGRGFAAVEHARDHGRDLLIWRAPAKRHGFIDKLFPHDTEVALRDLTCPLLLYRPPRGGRRTVAAERPPAAAPR